jgi:hypothetical protein
MYYDTHDRDEGVDGVEKCLVAIRLFLQMFNWSFRIELIKEMGDGGELIGRGLTRRVVGASLVVKTHVVGVWERTTQRECLMELLYVRIEP